MAGGSPESRAISTARSAIGTAWAIWPASREWYKVRARAACTCAARAVGVPSRASAAAASSAAWLSRSADGPVFTPARCKPMAARAAAS
jgi:hypothetical protein